uniref:Uncharacterized protein n=1 Tax=Mycena chlorophos TaxID=658473 RepID=A0ABQ0LAJ2_MYCCL|nr:predicted protein [Mycena chlorophos]
MVSASTTALFLALALPAAAQSDDATWYDAFSPDPLTMGIFVIGCIWAFCFVVLSIWNFVDLLMARGHRAPHALLLPTIVFFGWSNALYLARIVINSSANFDFADSLPYLTRPALRFAGNLVGDWGSVLFFLAIIAVAWNRETALGKTTEGRTTAHHPALIALHAVLAFLMFVLNTAAEGYVMNLNVEVYNGDFFTSVGGEEKLQSHANTANNLFYAGQSFIVLSFIDVLITSIVLWRGWRAAGISDRVSNLLLYAITPLYCLMSLFTMIFLIVFSPHGLPATTGLDGLEGADLADQLLPTLCAIVILFLMVLAGAKKSWWGEDEFKYPAQAWAAQQPNSHYMANPEPQTGYYTPPVQGAQTYAPAAAPASAPTPAEPVYESAVGGYTPSEPGHSAVGGTGPYSQQRGEKTGLHLA